MFAILSLIKYTENMLYIHYIYIYIYRMYRMYIGCIYRMYRIYKKLGRFGKSFGMFWFGMFWFWDVLTGYPLKQLLKMLLSRFIPRPILFF